MASWQTLQAAIISALKDDTIINSLTQGVWDHVPENAALPCIILGNVLSQPWRTCDMQGMQYRCDLRVVSTGTGRKLATQILERAREVVWNAVLSSGGQAVVARQIEQLELTTENAERTSEGALRIRLFTEDLS